MRSSDDITDLAAAFVAAQGEIEAAEKDRINPAFKSKYATLAAAVAASRPALAKHGLGVLQFATTGDQIVTVTTRLLHKSGQWIEDDLTLPVMKQDPQGVGSAITYGRRYGYCAMVGVIADEDDDGNAASRQAPAALKNELPTPTPPKGFQAWLDDLAAAADNGMKVFARAWKDAPEPFRSYAQFYHEGTLKALRKRAEAVKEQTA